MPRDLRLSPLKHTWVLDFDGTLVKHNGYKTGNDEWLPGAVEFLRSRRGILSSSSPHVRKLPASVLSNSSGTPAFVLITSSSKSPWGNEF